MIMPTCLRVGCPNKVKAGQVFCQRSCGNEHRASLRPPMPFCQAENCHSRVTTRTNKRCPACIAAGRR